MSFQLDSNRLVKQSRGFEFPHDFEDKLRTVLDIIRKDIEKIH